MKVYPDPIYQAWLDATNCYLAGAGLPPLKPESLREKYWDDIDDYEPDRYGMTDEERLDSPVHDLCRKGRMEQP